MLGRPHGQEGVPREAVLDREHVHATQEPLQTIEVGLSLSGHQRALVSVSRIMPALRHLGGVGRHILHAPDHEAGLSQQPLVLARRNQEVEADRAPLPKSAYTLSYRLTELSGTGPPGDRQSAASPMNVGRRRALSRTIEMIAS
jgi:hypothetical protein